MIGRLFGFGGGSEPPLPRERGPLRVALGGAIEVDTLAIEAAMAAGEPAMPVSQFDTLIVAAYGEAKLDADTVLSRYYDDRHRILQVLSEPGTGPEGIVDVSIYQPWDSVIPANAAEWRRWTGPDGLIGRAEYDADGILYRRYWGEGAGRAELVEFVEDVDDGDSVRAIHQRCMLYSRPVGAGEEMLLINVERDLDRRTSREGGSVEFLIGYGIAPGSVRRV